MFRFNTEHFDDDLFLQKLEKYHQVSSEGFKRSRVGQVYLLLEDEQFSNDELDFRIENWEYPVYPFCVRLPDRYRSRRSKGNSDHRWIACLIERSLERVLSYFRSSSIKKDILKEFF
jgi:hypothetical protein